MKIFIRFLSIFGLGVLLSKGTSIISNILGYNISIWVQISIYVILLVGWVYYELYRNKKTQS
jgi:hypothetical protein